MSDVTVSAPQLTESARTYLSGRPVHVRSSPRHGCCGGTASVPVAEPGAPEDLDGVERFEVSGVEIYVDRRLSGMGGAWTIDAEGFARWSRLVVLGVDLTSG